MEAEEQAQGRWRPVKYAPKQTRSSTLSMKKMPVRVSVWTTRERRGGTRRDWEGQGLGGIGREEALSTREEGESAEPKRCK